MIYFLLTIFIILVVWLLMIWIRKTLWDAVYRNFLDLEEAIEGLAARKSFASRPYFHGKFNGNAVTINFSSGKSDGKRLIYVDISFTAKSKISFSISEKNWLNNQNAGEPEDYSELQNSKGTTFIVRPASNKKVGRMMANPIVLEILDAWDDLAYLFAGGTGLICEFITEEVINATKVEAIMPRLKKLEQIAGVLSK